VQSRLKGLQVSSIIASAEEEEFSKAVVLHSKRNGHISHKKSIPMKLSLPQEEQHPKTMREISRESVCGGETREKRRRLGCKEEIIRKVN
jgi:hypothetical protein